MPIVDNVKSNSLLLFNESFASTNEREGSEIASHIVHALLDRNVKIFFVTHLYHFAATLLARRSSDYHFPAGRKTARWYSSLQIDRGRAATDQLWR